PTRLTLSSLSFYYSVFVHLRDLHSFPTRRSSDLTIVKYVNVVSGDKFVNIKVVIVTIPSPPSASHFAPKRSNSLPVIGDIIPITTAPGKSIRPDFNGVNPSASCINKGSNVSAPIKETSTIIVMVIARVNILNLNTRNSSIGTSSTSCLHINKQMTKIPTPIDQRTMAPGHPNSEAIQKPYTKAPNPTEDIIIERMSIFGLRKSVTFIRYRKAINIVMATNGNIVKNRACQLK